MRIWTTAFLSLALLFGSMSPAVLAADGDPLFINLTTDEPHRVNMALDFGTKQMNRGHPVTLFINDRAVFVAAKENAGKFAEQQGKIAALAESGALVIACPFCMQHYGVQSANLLPGIEVGNPDLTGGALFKDGTRTLTW